MSSGWAEAYIRTKWHLDPCSPLTAIGMSRKLGVLSPFWEGSWVPIYTMSSDWAEAYIRTKWHLDPYSPLTAIDMSQKLEGSVPFWGRGLGPHLAQSPQGRGLPLYQVAS